MVSFSFDRDDHWLQVLSFIHVKKCCKDYQQNFSFSIRSKLKAEISPWTFLHTVQIFKIPFLIPQANNALLVQISFQDSPAFFLKEWKPGWKPGCSQKQEQQSKKKDSFPSRDKNCSFWELMRTRFQAMEIKGQWMSLQVWRFLGTCSSEEKECLG